MRVAIRGGGVAGLACAAELHGRGHAVTVHEPAAAPGPHACSWWAGGMLAPQCEGETAPETVTRLGARAADWWQGQGADVSRRGSLVVALDRDRSELSRFARRTSGHVPADIAALEPMLAERFDAGLHFPDEAHLDPRRTLTALRTRLEAEGVSFVATQDAPRGPHLDCRGLAARGQLPDLRGVRGEMVVVRSRDIELSRPVRLLHPRHPLYIVPRGQGTFMLGATQIEGEGRGPATVRSVLELLGAAYALHPAFAEAELLETGADARPAFPDNVPACRRIGDVIHVNGLFRHGFLMAPALAMQAADMIEEDRHAHHA